MKVLKFVVQLFEPAMVEELHSSMQKKFLQIGCRLERLNQPIGQRTSVVKNFPNVNSVFMLVCARLSYVVVFGEKAKST